MTAGLPDGFEHVPMLSPLEGLQRLLGPAIGRHVVLEVDGEQVAGEITSVGMSTKDGPNGGPYVEVDGQRVKVTVDDLAQIIAGGTTDG